MKKEPCPNPLINKRKFTHPIFSLPFLSLPRPSFKKRHCGNTLQWRFFYTIISIGNNGCRPPNLFQNQFDYWNQGMRLYRRKIQNQIPGVTIFVLGGEMVN